MFCRQCGTACVDDARFCTHCGQALLPEKFPTAVPGQWNESDVMNEYYAAVIGPKNQAYYLRHFQNFDANGKAGPGWHWPGFFVTFWWLLYRKMWLNALLYFVLPYAFALVIGIFAAIAGKGSEIFLGIAYLAFIVAIWILPGLYGNALYYRHCQKKIEETRAAHREVQRQLGELAGKGGTSNVALIILLIFGMIAVVGILAAIAIPAYQDFTARAKMTEAYTAARQASEAVGRHYEQHRFIPGSLSQAGYVVALPPATGSLALNTENGTLTLTMASHPLKGKRLLLTPSLDDNNRVIWKCSSQEIVDKYLPAPCRKGAN